ncbi:membrane-fusion protein [Pelotomaculum thermopropionicum SI]|uniref:Membrane-fusion protein n=1 Tax=Pelotomaculum thermopropionicum (strain DSM 13744 / JCM 10971 / SI) TaxID=370438 RepID=A5D296_PELTS|nr:membrane-fusion protein [Pelotomaculum thermopropionicum SI]
MGGAVYKMTLFLKKYYPLVLEFFNKRKLFIGITVILALGLAVFYSIKGFGKTSAQYLTDTARKGDITNSISASGTIEPVETVSLGFKNSEIIKKIYVKVGDRVTAGQLLAEQESINLEAQLTQASASLKAATAKLELLKNGARPEEVAQARENLKIAQAAYDLAKAKLERYQKLYEEGAVSRADYDTANNEWINAEAKLKQADESLKLLLAGNRPEDIAAAEAQVESSTAQFQVAKSDLEGTKMFSPINGIVSAVNGAEGQRAAANNNNISGGGLIVIISEALQLKAQVNEADIGKLQVGQKAEFTVNSFPDRIFTGRVRSISPQAYTVSNVQIYDAVIQLDENQKGLLAGMPANVNIIVDRHENVLIVPKSAVTYAATYLARTGQSPASQRQAGGEGDGRRADAPKTGGVPGSGSGRGTGSAVPADMNEPKQQAAVLVLNGSGNPVLRQVVLGLSDLRSYEVIEGLAEGEKVVIGEIGQNAANSVTRTPGQSGNLFMLGPRSGSVQRSSGNR